MALHDTGALKDIKSCIWRIEKVTHKNGRPRLDNPYPELIGTVLTRLQIDIAARWVFIADNEGDPAAGRWRTTCVKGMKTDKNGTLRITTNKSIYTLRLLSEEVL